ncbi:MAG: hypothetical protein ACRD50_02405 [Candidatus Acidiferrales bacterium]
MTVCIAATVLDEWIIAISDRKVAVDGMSADCTITKVDPIHQSWCAMVSADDITSAVPIWDRVRQKLGFHYQRKEYPPEKTLEEVKDAFVEAYHEERDEAVANAILRPHAITHEMLFTSGRKLLGSPIFSDMWGRVERFDLGCSFIVAGFDKFKRSHVFTISHPGVYKNFDSIGFWAIGSGSYQALTSMFLIDEKHRPTYEGLLYEVCAAKFTAETDPHVGKFTTLLVYQSGKDCPEFYGDKEIESIKKQWEENGRPKRPPSVEEAIKLLKRFPITYK